MIGDICPAETDFRQLRYFPHKVAIQIGPPRTIANSLCKWANRERLFGQGSSLRSTDGVQVI